MKTFKLRKFYPLIIFIFLILIFTTLIKTTRHRPYNPKERNNIVFEISEKEIYDSLNNLGNIMEKLPTQDRRNTQIGINNENFLLNYKSMGNLNSLLILNDIPFYEFKELSVNEFRRLLNLTKYIYSNRLYHIQYNNRIKFPICLYRKFGPAGDYHTDLLRYICDRKNINEIKESFKILDTTDYFVLYTEKDARIWEGK